MKNLIRIGSILFALSFVFFVGCSDDELKPENFTSQEEAQTALYQSDFLVLFALSRVNEVSDIANDFDGTYPSDFVFKNRSSASLNKQQALHTLVFNKKFIPNTFGYNSQTGYWIFDTTVSQIGFTESVNGKIRFSPRDAVTGFPNSSTNTMEYELLVSANGSGEGGVIDLEYDTKLDVTGIAGFRDTTGSATISGSTDLSWLLDFTDETGAFLYDFEFNNAINAVIVSLSSPYPISGNIEFTAKGEFNADTLSEKYFVSGKITFDGSNIALLEFGGYTFHIDLDGPYIVELD